MTAGRTYLIPLKLVLLLVFVLSDSLATSVPDWSQRLKKPWSAPCKNNADCMYLGECVSGVCKCDPGFRGNHCHELDLLPTQRDWGYLDPVRPSWGGTVIRRGSKYILFASYIVNECDIAQYGTNSAILRAEAAHPQGPYEYVSTLLPPFHHGTVTLEDHDGNVYVYHDGKDIPSKYVHNCLNKKQSKGMPQRVVLTSSMKSGLFKFGESPHDYIRVSRLDAKTLNRTDEQTIIKTDLRAGIACNRTNPSPLLMEDGSVLLALRTTFCSPAGRPACDYHTNCQHIYLVRQRHPLDPVLEDEWQLIKQLEASEDPFLWRSARGHYHILAHSKRACGIHDTGGCAVLASSKDSSEWTSASRSALRGVVHFRETGKAEKASLLQRPKIMFDQDGTTPLFLICGYRRKPNGQVFTLFIPFNVSANVHLTGSIDQAASQNTAEGDSEDLEEDNAINEEMDDNNDEDINFEPEIIVVDDRNETQEEPPISLTSSPSTRSRTVSQAPTSSPTHYDPGVLPVDIKLPDKPDPRPEQTIHDQPVRIRWTIWGWNIFAPQAALILGLMILIGVAFKRRTATRTPVRSSRAQYSQVNQSIA